MVVVGTGTEVGKTWVSARALAQLRAAGVSVAARKPAQSFEAGTPSSALDATILAGATGERAEQVCLPSRSYAVAMAPPMAADALGQPPILLDELVAELRWPASPSTHVGLVETAGGLRSPIANDADNLGLVDALAPDLVVLVADAGLGTINLVRLCTDALVAHRVVVVLNRFDAGSDLHARNRAWLADRDRCHVLTSAGDLAELLRHGHTF